MHQNDIYGILNYVNFYIAINLQKIQLFLEQQQLKLNSARIQLPITMLKKFGC